LSGTTAVAAAAGAVRVAAADGALDAGVGDSRRQADSKVIARRRTNSGTRVI
jgi:hypothetical protein